MKPNRGSYPTLELSYPITMEDALAARRLTGARLRRIHQSGDSAAAIVGVVLALIGYPVGLVLTLIAAVFAILSLGSPVQRRILSRRRSHLTGGIATVRIGGDGVRFESNNGEVTLPWSAIESIRADQNTVVLLGERGLIGYIPRRAFSSSEDVQRLVALDAG